MPFPARLLSLALMLAISAGILGFGLTGCKPTNSLYREVQDQRRGVVDYSKPPVAQDAPDADSSQDSSAHEQDRSQRQDQQQQTQQQFSSADLDGQQVPQTSYAPTGDDVEDLKGGASSSQDGSAQGDSNDEVPPIEGGSGAGDSDDAGQQGSGITHDEGSKNDETPTPGGGGTPVGPGGGTIYPDITKLPHHERIAATGDYAILVQMLGGKGALAAADAQTLAALRGAGAFPGEGIESVQTAWSGDGSLSNEADVAAIEQSGAQAVLVASGTSTLAQAQAEQLAAQGIDVIQMPALGTAYTADADIQAAVSAVGTILSQAGGSIQYNASKMAATWRSQHDGAIQAALSANGGYGVENPYSTIDSSSLSFIYQRRLDGGYDQTYGYATATDAVSSQPSVYTAVVAGWDSTAVTATVWRVFQGHQIYPSKAGEKYGNPVRSPQGSLSQVLVGGRENMDALVGKVSFPLAPYYLQCGGVAAAVNPNNQVDNGPNDNRDLYMKFSNYGSQLDDDQVFVYPGNTRANGGSVDFPAVLAATDDIARNLAASGSLVDGLYNYGKPYDVYVAPTGIAGSWLLGSPESFLLSGWSYDRFHGKAVDTSRIDDFYKTFYRRSFSGAVRDLTTTEHATAPKS